MLLILILLMTLCATSITGKIRSKIMIMIMSETYRIIPRSLC
jgi:hypothetical protein